MNEIYKNLDLNDLPNEIWLPIEGYNGLYEVSNMGRVKSLGNDKIRKEKILHQGNMKNGYLYVVLCKEGKMKTCTVHRLVATAFIQNPNGYRCVNHKDEDKTNNRVENLEPCDHKYNSNYGTAQQRRVDSTDYKAFQQRRVANTDWKAIGKKNAKKLTNGVLSKKVYQYSQDGTLVTIWESTQECQRNGFNSGAVSACCRNCYMIEGNNVYKGYIWSYEEL